MRKIIAGGVLLAALALAGCATTTAAPTPAPTPNSDAQFTQTIDRNEHLIGAEKEARALAHSMCALAAQVGFADAYDRGLAAANTNNLDIYDYDYMVRAGVQFYCPEQLEAMNQRMGLN